MGVLSLVFLVLGIVALIGEAHHPIKFWLVLGLVCLEVATLIWGAQRGHSREAAHIHLHPPAEMLEGDTFETTPTEGGGIRITKRGDDRATESRSQADG